MKVTLNTHFATVSWSTHRAMTFTAVRILHLTHAEHTNVSHQELAVRSPAYARRTAAARCEVVGLYASVCWQAGTIRPLSRPHTGLSHCWLRLPVVRQREVRRRKRWRKRQTGGKTESSDCSVYTNIYGHDQAQWGACTYILCICKLTLIWSFPNLFLF